MIENEFVGHETPAANKNTWTRLNEVDAHIVVNMWAWISAASSGVMPFQKGIPSIY